MKKKKVKNKWYKLDNAAKLFPSLFKDSDRNGFRLTALLKEDIKKEPLAKALDETLERYPSYCVKLRKGFFWYYFDHNFEKPIIQDENPVIFSTIQLYKNNNYLFSVCTHKKRLSLEVFHSLGDGTGALEFFKTLLYYYFIELGYEIINPEEYIKTNEIEQTISEVDDSFNTNYNKKVKKYHKEDKAFTIKGKKYDNNWIGLINTIINIDTLKTASHKYKCTITEYIGACILYSAYLNFFKDKKVDPKRKMKLFIPVNARKFFSSKTIRNFALFIRTNTDLATKENVTFNDMIVEIKKTFEVELTKEKLEQRIVQNVSIEKNAVIRILPLWLKDIVMRIGFSVIGGGANTLSFSNLGEVKLPPSMMQYIDRFEFQIGVSKDTPTNITGISYNGIFCLSFQTILQDRTFIRSIIQCLVNDGVDFYIETNDLEVQ